MATTQERPLLAWVQYSRRDHLTKELVTYSHESLLNTSKIDNSHFKIGLLIPFPDDTAGLQTNTQA